MLLACFFVLLCVLAYFFRQSIFNLIGSLLYTIIRKSIESCAGKILVENSHSSDVSVSEPESCLAGYPVVPDFGLGRFIIDAKMVGQNFDLNFPKNAKYCTPDARQDLYPNDDLA